ncbi:MAG: cytochrome c [Alphaproteobacteria bacterium]|nr:cytochrome c [Alphaproteobacteria bacterium]
MNTLLRGLSLCLCALLLTSPSLADPKSEHTMEETEFVHGAPQVPTDAWTLAAGGRIYDRWWKALDRDEPKGTHPAYPKDGKKSGPATWRCKECHGWDYRGNAGRYGSGSHRTGIKGIDGAKGRDAADIARLLRSPLHGYTKEMIRDNELARLAAFVSRGQDETSKFVNPQTGEVIGDAMRGKAIFQTVCAACHGFDGRLLNWGTEDEPAYIGTEANAAPDEVLHKIRNSHPGAAMVNLRAFAIEDAASVLLHAKSLPQK